MEEPGSLVGGCRDAVRDPFFHFIEKNVIEPYRVVKMAGGDVGDPEGPHHPVVEGRGYCFDQLRYPGPDDRALPFILHGFDELFVVKGPSGLFLHPFYGLFHLREDVGPRIGRIFCGEFDVKVGDAQFLADDLAGLAHGITGCRLEDKIGLHLLSIGPLSVRPM